jgi:site-specific recombinase XerD
MYGRIRWERLPVASGFPPARDWLARQARSDLSASTVAAYSRALERYLAYCRDRRIDPAAATTVHLAHYFDELTRAGLGGAAQRQRLIAIRLFYAHVIDLGLRGDNPAASTIEPRPPTPALWVPDEEEWASVLAAARAEPPRTRLMLAVSYIGALRREDLCRLRIGDLDLSYGALRFRTGGSDRVVGLVPAIARQLAGYVRGHGAGEPLFRSSSRRNLDQPITIWTWAKVTRRIAMRSGVQRFTAITPRHLRLTDLARAGWGALDIARSAGYRSPRLARSYVRLAKERRVPRVEQRRIDQLVQLLNGTSR